jgi:hypothetical protein
MKKEAALAQKQNKINRIPKKPKWQTGEYERFAKYNFTLPYHFLLICKLLEVPPAKVLYDFMEVISCTKTNLTGEKVSVDPFINYFEELGYGNQFFDRKDLQKIFGDIKSIALLWPHNAKTELIDIHATWLKNYHKYWFKKWYYKSSRKLS